MFQQATARLTRRSFPADISAAKSRVAQWEPNLSLPQFPHGNIVQDEDDGPHWMTTYSAFDPGMMRPLLLSGISLDVERINLSVFAVPKSPALATYTPHMAYTFAKPSHTQPVVNMSTKPWPYSLPDFLHPKPGTTFGMMHGSGLVALEKAGNVGFLQAVLFGVPDPDNDGEKAGDVVEVQDREVGGKGLVAVQSESFEVVVK
ncbi:hypothetical protein HBH56_010450 [Parastagonospora nodorum]|uniref:Uncharacterized protein n=2 Tax=Phaeosphaeria nodorum (strain SN15 / ATCC MYA-4574 / FGSC 10173) TaxID=321614 RepID=A0A7U2EPS0_PHANO|nr:hypothetical protein SNOG_00245 [Parastagonospora nodorum SN15]KAH3920822.1 hypothetical protein HBH56_010450 [Parastagonospora nodorum]EAT91740.1 hypothetical protein SNOG_00245 [Parastagonospora nodorum SN15]KAH3934990.1 hypothetical protein HBH54_043750 [Parastagonospora nodorum]KAH3987131.1 hypothetical protein HBH51_013040 [Parastagonospora nodorum]KAH3987403.1 hypothetical protein HBH52_034320 [Parastagonospora nodorum]